MFFVFSYLMKERGGVYLMGLERVLEKYGLWFEEITYISSVFY